MIYRFARFICRVILFVKARWQVQGDRNLPDRGGVVIVSNHASNWDPVIVGCSFLHRKVHFMAKEELFKILFVKQLVTALGAYPVKRGKADRGAIKESIKLLEEGHALGIFPEGTRASGDELKEAYNGAAFLALKAKVPILPVAVNGSREFKKVRVKVGHPIYLDEYLGKKIDKEVLNTVSKLFMEAIERLKTA